MRKKILFTLVVLLLVPLFFISVVHAGQAPLSQPKKVLMTPLQMKDQSRAAQQLPQRTLQQDVLGGQVPKAFQNMIVSSVRSRDGRTFIDWKRDYPSEAKFDTIMVADKDWDGLIDRVDTTIFDYNADQVVHRSLQAEDLTSEARRVYQYGFDRGVGLVRNLILSLEWALDHREELESKGKIIDDPWGAIYIFSQGGANTLEIFTSAPYLPRVIYQMTVQDRHIEGDTITGEQIHLITVERGSPILAGDENGDGVADLEQVLYESLL